MEHVIGFFGGDSHTGTTIIAWSFAERLSAHGKRVLLIFGSGNDDRILLSGDNGQSIDNLKAMVRSGRVERDDVLASTIKRNRLVILPGIKNILGTDYFLENTFQMLLASLDGEFDAVVIDGGSDPRLGLTISALHASRDRYFVVTQEAKALHRYLQKQKQLLAPFGLEGRIIVNQYRRDPSLYLKKDISRMLGADVFTVVPYVEGGWQAEMEGKHLLHFAGFARSVEELVRTYTEDEKKVRKWKRPFVLSHICKSVWPNRWTK